MQDDTYPGTIQQICKEDPRYDRRAYDFVRLGLDYAAKEMTKRDTERARNSRHVTGQELSLGLRQYALDQYGPLAKTVLAAWGIQACEDFGEIVYNLIEYGLLSKTESDKKEDFAGVYTFDEAFVQPYQPAHRRLRPSPETP